MRYWILFVSALSALLCPRTASGQGIPFQILVQQDGNVAAVSNNANLGFAANAVGQTVQATVTLTNIGASYAVMNAAPQLLGAVAFRVTAPNPPLIVPSNGAVTYLVEYTPASSKVALAELLIGYQLPPATPNAPPTSGTITLNLTGTAPELTVSYSLQSDGNVLSLAPGGKLQFDPTPVGTTASATLIVTNLGSGPGAINSVVLGGGAFQLLGVPLLPATLAAGSAMQFAIRYSPSAIATDTGTLNIVFGGARFSATVQASSAGPRFTYELVRSAGTVPLAPGGQVTFPDTFVGSTATVAVRVSNTGNGSGALAAITTAGTGFGVTDVPFLPVTMAPSDSLTFRLAFAPGSPGRSTGRLRVGNDVFDMAGNGLGPNLVYAYAAGSATKTVGAGGGIVFSPTPVGQEAAVQFSIQNAGTATATITSIGIGANASAFRIDGLPSLPMTLPANASSTFTVIFSPLSTGFATATLQVDAQSFTLSGLGNPPPPLPDCSLTAAPDAQGPMQQPAVKLSLASAYSLPLKGTLSITFESTAFSLDPALQFSSGGQTVSFSIPANSTQAVFPNGSTQVRLQTGTVAGAIVITPSFTTTSGLPLTPPSAPSLRLPVAEAAPQLLSVQVSGKTANSLNLLISGYATTRTLSTLSFQFTTTSDIQLTGQEVTIDLGASAANWFGNAASQAFGGQFAITMPFTLSTAATGITSPVDKIQSVTVVATNALGSSNPISTSLQ